MKIIETYLPDQFAEIPSKRLMDFVTVNPRSSLDMSILETWKNHFQSVSVPYVITEDEHGIKTLRKERRV